MAFIFPKAWKTRELGWEIRKADYLDPTIFSDDPRAGLIQSFLGFRGVRALILLEKVVVTARQTLILTAYSVYEHIWLNQPSTPTS